MNTASKERLSLGSMFIFLLFLNCEREQNNYHKNVTGILTSEMMKKMFVKTSQQFQLSIFKPFSSAGT